MIQSGAPTGGAAGSGVAMTEPATATVPSDSVADIIRLLEADTVTSDHTSTVTPSSSVPSLITSNVLVGSNVIVSNTALSAIAAGEGHENQLGDEIEQDSAQDSEEPVQDDEQDSAQEERVQQEPSQDNAVQQEVTVTVIDAASTHSSSTKHAESSSSSALIETSASDSSSEKTAIVAVEVKTKVKTSYANANGARAGGDEKLKVDGDEKVANAERDPPSSSGPSKAAARRREHRKRSRRRLVSSRGGKYRENHHNNGNCVNQNADEHDALLRNAINNDGDGEATNNDAGNAYIPSDDEQLAHLIRRTRQAEGFTAPIDVPFLIEDATNADLEEPSKTETLSDAAKLSSRSGSSKTSLTFHPWWFVLILAVSASSSTGFSTSLPLAWRQMGSVPAGLVYTGLFLLNLESVRTFVDLVIATAHASSHFREAAGWNCGR
jgi:hypothetical protein